MSIRFLQMRISELPLWKEQMINTRVALRDVTLKHWLESCIFTPIWWLMLITFIATWFIWWKFVNKTKLLEIIAYGLLVSFLSTILDLLGTERVLWGYPNMLMPIVPPLFIVDVGVLPVVYMLIYQYFPDWIKFTIAISITAFFIAFLGEPLAIWLDIYEMNNWKHMYSFPGYIVLALLLKWILMEIIEKQENSSKEQEAAES